MSASRRRAYLAMPEVITALESFADVGSDPEWAKVKPYLETIAAVVAGGEKDGDRLRSRFAVRLK